MGFVVWEGPVAVEGDADYTVRLTFEFISISFHGGAVGDQDVVRNYPGFFAGIADWVFHAIGGAAWRKGTGAVAEDSAAVGFVEGDPMANFGQGFEADTCVVFEISDELVFVEEAAIGFLEVVGKIPVEEGDHWSDAGVKKIIDELHVVVDSCLGDEVFATAIGDNSGPGYREAVGFCSTGL